MNVLSLSFDRTDEIDIEETFKKINERVLEEKKDIDLIVFPEYWIGNEVYNKEFIDKMCNHSKILKIYLAFPIYIKDNDKTYNRLHVVSPEGKVVFTYNKINLYYKEKNITNGSNDQKVYWEYKNFKIGFAICFDINFNNIWSNFDKNDVDLVIWMSTYVGGRKLKCYAGVYHYYILTSTMQNSAVLYDITGEKISEKKEVFNFFNIPSKDERNIYHYNKNIDIILQLKRYLQIEKKYDDEQWLILVRKDENNLRDLEKKYSLISLRDYIRYGLNRKDKYKA